MTRAKELAGLIERLEAATGPDREIDCAIAVAIDGFYTKPHPGWPDDPSWTMYCQIDEDGNRVEPGNAPDMLVPPYTASIDAALGLVERVLPGRDYILERTNGGLTISCLLGTSDPDKRTFSDTLPLAILLALLRALSARSP